MAAPPDALAPTFDRRAGSPGEREALRQLQTRLKGLGLDAVREGFVTVTSRSWVVFAHLALAVPFAVGSWWRPGWCALALAVSVALMWAEWDGRRVLRDYLPRGRSYNLLVRIPPAEGEVKHRRVLVARVDQRLAGDGFSGRLLAAGACSAAVTSVAALLRHLWAAPLLDYILLVAGGLLGVVTAMAFLLWRSVRGVGESPGVARLLELAERPPSLPETEIVLAFCGAGFAYGAGLRALKRQHRHEWGPETRYKAVGEGPIRLEAP